MKHTDIWYQNRLNKHFDKYYSEFKYDAEFYPDPAPNQWLFDIPDLNLTFKLTCQEDGRVRETQSITLRR